MPAPSLTYETLREEDFRSAAECMAKGEYAAAGAAVAAVLVASTTGHPILGGLTQGALTVLAKGVTSAATRRLLDAVESDEHKSAETHLLSIVNRLFAANSAEVDDLKGQGQEQFLQTLRFVERTIASAEAGIREELAAVQAHLSSLSSRQVDSTFSTRIDGNVGQFVQVQTVKGNIKL